MPKKTGKGKKKAKKKKTSKSEDSGPVTVGKIPNKTMVQQMASVSLSPVPIRQPTTREKVSFYFKILCTIKIQGYFCTHLAFTLLKQKS